MRASRTTLSFLDLALMLLSAFAYSHFLGLADAEKKAEMAAAEEAERITGRYEYNAAAIFGGHNVMLTEFARQEFAEKQTAHRGELLVITVPPQSGDSTEHRLRQWEKVAARSAAIADAFAAAGKDGRMIEVEMPVRMLSDTEENENISLVFLSPEKDPDAP